MRMSEQPSPTTHRIAYLAGHGVGPEVTAAASRALDHLSRRYGFRVDEVHPPFGAETLMHAGTTLPPATQRATSTADAILVAGATEPALAILRASAAPVVRVTRTLDALGDSTVFAPLDDSGMPAAIDRAVAAAGTTGVTVVAVGLDEASRTAPGRDLDGHRRAPLARRRTRAPRRQRSRDDARSADGRRGAPRAGSLADARG